jgi:adenylate kinase family enzyme
MQRMCVVGTSGSGKTTLADTLARRLGVSHVELDALHWDPGWTPAATDVFRARIEAALEAARDGWVTDGNYSKVLDTLWSRADTLVWLDYSLPLVLWRVTKRTARRLGRREVLWNGNRETLRGLLFDKDSLIWWVLKTHIPRRKRALKLIAEPRYAHLTVHRFRTPAETANWLASIPAMDVRVPPEAAPISCEPMQAVPEAPVLGATGM